MEITIRREKYAIIFLCRMIYARTRIRTQMFIDVVVGKIWFALKGFVALVCFISGILIATGVVSNVDSTTLQLVIGGAVILAAIFVMADFGGMKKALDRLHGENERFATNNEQLEQSNTRYKGLIEQSEKQIARQEDACTIGYGGMLLEGGLAVIALICVSAGLGGGERLNYFIIDQHNPIAAFNEGYGNLTKSFLGTFGGIFSATILNAFILTTLDTATRIGRYLTEELFGIKNRYISTAIIVCCAVCMTFSGSSDKIWPVFGASNQLVAALALIVLSCWLLGMGKKTWFVSIPAIVMLITAVTALVLNGIKFYNNSTLQ